MSIPLGMKAVVNRRSRFVVHLTAAESPKHSDKTVCGLVLKGSRWSLSGLPPTCPGCLEGRHA